MPPPPLDLPPLWETELQDCLVSLRRFLLAGVANASLAAGLWAWVLWATSRLSMALAPLCASLVTILAAVIWVLAWGLWLRIRQLRGRL